MSDEHVKRVRSGLRRIPAITLVAAAAMVGAVAPSVTTEAGGNRPLRAHATDRVIVRFRDGVSALDTTRVMNSHGIRGHKDLRTPGTRTELLEIGRAHV